MSRGQCTPNGKYLIFFYKLLTILRPLWWCAQKCGKTEIKVLLISFDAPQSTWVFNLCACYVVCYVACYANARYQQCVLLLFAQKWPNAQTITKLNWDAHVWLMKYWTTFIYVHFVHSSIFERRNQSILDFILASSATIHLWHMNSIIWIMPQHVKVSIVSFIGLAQQLFCLFIWNTLWLPQNFPKILALHKKSRRYLMKWHRQPQYTFRIVTKPHRIVSITPMRQSETKKQTNGEQFGWTHFKLVVGVSTDFSMEKCIQMHTYCTEKSTLFSQWN